MGTNSEHRSVSTLVTIERDRPIECLHSSDDCARRGLLEQLVVMDKCTCEVAVTQRRCLENTAIVITESPLQGTALHRLEIDIRFTSDVLGNNPTSTEKHLR